MKTYQITFWERRELPSSPGMYYFTGSWVDESGEESFFDSFPDACVIVSESGTEKVKYGFVQIHAWLSAQWSICNGIGKDLV